MDYSSKRIMGIYAKWVVVGISTVVLGGLLLLGYLVAERKARYGLTGLKVFLLGMFGWLAAYFLRIIPLQFLQIGSLWILGADLQNIDSIVEYATLYQYHFLVLMWGPLLAGIFESLGRFFCVKYKKVRANEAWGPFYLGLGWTTSEILLIFVIPLIQVQTDTLPWGPILIGIEERIIVSVAHITLCYLAYYTNYEEKFWKPSLLWIMVWHWLMDFSIVVWLIFFRVILADQELLYVLSLEVVFLLITIAMFLFTFYFWRQHSRLKYQQRLQQQQDKLDQTGPVEISRIF